MNDSHNLIWKITQVLRGWAKTDILSTYEFERRKYAQDLIEFDKKWAALFSGKAQTEADVDGVSHENFLATFQSFGEFTSGVGVHYAPSLITSTTHQAKTSKLEIGKRLPPQVIVRAADSRPYEIQDLLPSDIRYKILVFSGNSTDEGRQGVLDELATKLAGENGVLHKFGKKEDMFDVIAISTATKDTIDYTDIPILLRTHWSKVFIDDLEIKGVLGGKAYESYGISREEGAIVVIRPDGYVGFVAGLDQVDDLAEYFGKFF